MVFIKFYAISKFEVSNNQLYLVHSYKSSFPEAVKRIIL